MKKNKLSIYSTELENKILSDVFDQDFAVSTLIKTLFQSSFIQNKGKTKAIFTFIGQNNCGKKHLARTLLKYDPSVDKLKIFYMERYSFAASSSEQYSSYSFENEFIEFIQNNPKSIVIFKDIEKSDLQTQFLLYTMLTSFDKEQLDLSDVIVIFDTTVLSSLIKRKDFLKVLQTDPLQAQTFLAQKLSQESININSQKEPMFNSKLLSLINEQTVIPFNVLKLETLAKIASRILHETSRNYTSQNHLQIQFDDYEYIVWAFLLSLSPFINTKYIKQKLPKQLLNIIYEVSKNDQEVKNICFEISKNAKNYLNKILKDKDNLTLDISSLRLHLEIKWAIKDKIDEDYTSCKIQALNLEKEKLSLNNVENLNISKYSFDDVAGHKKVKKELKEIIELFKSPQNLKAFDLKLPKGMILQGPQGMGKKLLAKAFAKEAGFPYILISGSDLFDIAKINQAYQIAYTHAPSIVIFEDIDTEGILNGMISTMSMEPLIYHLDHLEQSFDAPVFTIITTSDSQNIPSLLLEAQRININIEVPKLDMDARRFFIKELLKKPHDENIDIERIVRYISGMSGNELKRVSQEACLYAARKGKNILTEEIILEQINIIKYGTKLENKQIRDIEISMKKTAYHEAGHAVLSYILLPKIKIEQVTIAPRSEALGFVSYNNEEYIDATSKEELFNDICVLLAGRVAKMEKFGLDGMETGAVSDLEVATNQAYAAIALFGMDEELGYINISSLTAGLNKQLFSDKVEQRVLEWLKKAKEKTQLEVKKNWKAIEAVALALVEKEVIDFEELKEIIRDNLS